VRGKLFLLLLLPVGLFVVPLLPASAATEEVKTEPSRAKGPDDLLRGFSLSSQRGPVTIRANKLEFDYRSRILTYRGTVSVTQDDLTMHSDLLRVTLDPEARQPVQKIEAEGAVRIAKGEREATGGRAVFDQKKRTVTLSDNAKLRDGPNEVAGERVVVYLDEERSVVEGGDQRVRAVLFPPGKGTDAEGSSPDHD
jgi:lipopolysaccharide export system protein LptA